jgi:hypothetical protein
MDQIPQELIDMQQSLASLFWDIKEQGKLARENAHEPVVSCDTDQAERTIHAEVMRLGQRLMGEFFKGIGTGDLGFRIDCNGREYERKHTAREASILTSFGPVAYRRSVYYSKKGESLQPFDQMANLPDRGITYFAQELMTRLGIEESYADSQSFYAEFFGHSLSSHTIGEVVQQTASNYPAYSSEQVSMPEEPSGRIGVVTFDGKGVPVVPSERTTGKTREALVGGIYTIEPEERDAEQLANLLVMPEILSAEDKEQLRRQNRAQNIQYFANIGKPKDALFEEVRQAATARFAACLPTTVVCLMDGALKLWQLAHTYFPDAVYILDLMHVLGYLRTAVAALEKNDERARVLLCAYLEWILKGEVETVIKSMRIRLSKNKLRGQKCKDIEAAVTYFTNHRNYMRYDEYLAAGCPIATGVIESACKHIVKNRMDKSGAQWTIRGAESVLRLRCLRATGHWKQFSKIRQRDERKRLYSNMLTTAA